MGRQIGFFLAESDQAPFEAALREAGPFRIFTPQWPSAEPQELPSTLVQSQAVHRLRVLLMRPQDASQIRASRVPQSLEYRVDATDAPVLEYDRCFIQPTFIRRGRLYFQPTYMTSEDVRRWKDDRFIAWADRALASARRWLKPLGGHIYAGPEAVRLAASGLELKQF